MLKEVLDKIFLLPPLNQRKDIRHFWFSKFFGTMPATPHKDDCYLHYQVAYTAAYACVIAGIICMYVYLTHMPVSLFFYEIEFSTSDPIIKLFEQYRDVVSVLLISVVGFFLVKLRWNINPVLYDVFWRKEAHLNFKDSRGKLRITKIRVHALTVMAMAVALMFSAPFFWGALETFVGFRDRSFFVFFAFVWIVYATIWAPVIFIIGVSHYWHTVRKVEKSDIHARKK